MKKNSNIEVYVNHKLRVLDPFKPKISLGEFLFLADGVYRNCGTSSVSVLDHSLVVWDLVFSHPRFTEKMKLFALWHDMGEVFLGDLPSPLKATLEDFKTLEGKLVRSLFNHYTGLVLSARELSQFSTALKVYDHKAYELEKKGKLFTSFSSTALEIFKKQGILASKEHAHGCR